MSSPIDWFCQIIRIAGVNFPGAASLVQLQTEIDSVEVKSRLQKLEDPISFIHEKVPEISKVIYGELKSNDSVNLQFPDDFYLKYSQALAGLEKKRFIKLKGVAGSRIPHGLKIVDPSYIMYMCFLAEDTKKIQKIMDMVEQCKYGESLNGDNLKIKFDLPVNVIRAVFEIYAEKGLGVVSKTIGKCIYSCVA